MLVHEPRESQPLACLADEMGQPQVLGLARARLATSGELRHLGKKGRHRGRQVDRDKHDAHRIAALIGSLTGD